MMKHRVDSRLIAALSTLLIAALIAAVLLFCGLSWDNSLLAAGNPSPSEEQEEPVFLEPELLDDAGDELPDVTDEPQAAQAGVPDNAPVENKVVEIPSENPKPAPKVEKPITQSKPSPVKATTPPKSDKPEKRATDPTAGKFSSNRNGNKNTSGSSSGTGSSGVGISGKVRGRSFLGCDKPAVFANQKTVVTVSITVNADGRVTSARATGGDAAQRRACERAAKTARWSAKKGETEARGTLTFTITPKL